MKSSQILGVESIAKQYQGIHAIQDLSFDVRRGEVLGIIGPNGAGKTTLFNVISGFEPLTRGRIMLRQVRVDGSRPDQMVRRGLVRTFQQVRPFPGLTVRENLMVAGLTDGIFTRPQEIRRAHDRAETVAALIGIEQILDRVATELPYGSLKLLDLGRALVLEPEILLLDEPFAGVSGSEGEGILRTIKEFHDRGLTILIIEHKLSMLMRLVERVIVLSSGKMISEGTPAEIARDPEVRIAYLGKKGAEYLA